MGNADRITAVLLLAVSVAFSAGALKFYDWWGPGGPGSAFLPFWLGLAMAGLAVLMLVRKAGSGGDWLPRGEGLRHLLAVLGATIGFVALLKLVGMILGSALYLAVLVRYLGRHRWPVVLGVALGAALVNWLVFVHWLRVPFPQLGVWIL